MAVKELEQHIAGLSPEKRALLEQRLMERKSPIAEEQRIPRREEEGPYPLSFAQQRLWFLDQMEPDSRAYNMPKAMRINGAFNVDVLQKTLDALVARHEVLRTTFASVDGSPVQVITESRSVELPVIDLREWAPAEREVEAQRLIVEHIGRPFNLSQDLMLRALLLRLDKEEHHLLLTTHHIASDGWSRGILYRELATLYEAFSTGNPSPLPELPIQYTDFARWQRERMQGKVLESQLSYWKQQLGDHSAVLALPTDRPRPAVQTYQGARQSLALPKTLSDSLQALSRQERVTLFMTLLAAFQTLLHRYTGQDDIVVGSPIAGRTRSETEGLIGFFVNMLTLRTDFSGDPSFQELLHRVREVALGHYAHADIPFEKLVEELKPERDLSRNPLFQVCFALQNTPKSILEIPGLTLTSLEVDKGTTPFDLTLHIAETDDGLRASAEYNTDLFDSATITRMLGQFQTLLEGIAADPEKPVSRLPILTDAERHQLLVKWDKTKSDYPRDSCIHQLFEAQMMRTSDAVAVEYEDRQLTYWELNRRANQLAHHLKSLGVGSEVLVGICVERSLEMVVGVLGILKAGGAYVPLDPSYPKERLAFMMEDAQVGVLLTQQHLAASLPDRGAQVVCLDSDWEVISQESVENPCRETTAENLAYVIYTSGSTGKPKGVAVPHRAVVRLVCNTNYVNLQASDRVAQASNASFDAATFEIWGTLLHGARLIGITKDVALSPRDFAIQIRKQKISVLFLTTALFNLLSGEVPDAFRSVRDLLFGGEAVDPTMVREVLKIGPPQRLLHMYGPTEATTFATWYVVEDVPEGVSTIPIGLPIGNTQTYILDNNLQPVPTGVRGELYIGGDGLARGYLNQQELTTEKFIPNPFSDEPEARLYKTGDVVRYLLDGSIEFLGRLDEQVKIRGFRVEPGEIEAVLSQHPGVWESVVTAREEVPGSRRLVAYIVPIHQSAPAISNLRSFLSQKLPDYMVPSAFVSLDALPLTSNGKVDHTSLPAPDLLRPNLTETLVLPRNEKELQLTKIWESVLDTHPIGVKDNFFELGGHSLLAVSLFTKIEKMFGSNLPLATLFQAPTVEQLAELLIQEGWSPPWSSLVAVQPNGSKPPFFLVHGGGGHVLHCYELAVHLDAEQPLYGLQAQGLDGRKPPYTRIEDMARHYINEMRSLFPEGPYFLGGRSGGGVVAFEMGQQLIRDGYEVPLLILFDTGRPDRRHSQQDTRSFHDRYRIDYHMENLSRLGPKDKLLYILQRPKRVTTRMRRKIWNKTWNIASSFYESIGHPLPRPFQDVKRANRRAIYAYSPQVYPGPLTLFKASRRSARDNRDSDRGWKELAGRGLEIREVPGDHGTIWTEPHAGALANELQDCLSEAQEPRGR